jgi:2-polyprenyl-6-methoxyphenol hydroxylase-like FAD-dependent oxidoreductase
MPGSEVTLSRLIEPHPPLWRVVDGHRSIDWAGRNGPNAIMWIPTVKALKERFEATAFECFHYGHTFVILPLGSKESSVVVTANTDHANQLLVYDDARFCQFVMQKFGEQLGSMTRPD